MKQNHLIAKSVFAGLLFCLISLTPACKKQSSCFDEKLYRQSKDKFCTADCPGVRGCDGKTYCNACEAARHGIRVK